jgi:hypothetical protein
MTKNVYKTAQGRVIDMGKLILQNEKVRAVGNMNVNARGDVIGDDDRVIKSRSQQVNQQYKQQTQGDKPKS